MSVLSVMSVSALDPESSPEMRPPSPIRAEPLLAMRSVSKHYGSGVTRQSVLRDIDLEVREGEFLAVVGFSGSGKTTLAQLLAGLIEPDGGTITMRGRSIQGPGPERGLVFQNYSLLPWLTVRGNIALSVNRVFRRWSRARRREHVQRFIDLVGLSHAAHRRPHELSGGMRQRTSLARTLAVKPEVLLLDEPLSALDALTRGQLQTQILKIWEEERQTCVMITNDVDEALLMADRIVPLNPGPAASLGPIFDVPLPRPRDATELNHQPQYRSLRNAVTKYLIEVRDAARERRFAGKDRPAIRLPDIQPQDLKLPRKAILNSTV